MPFLPAVFVRKDHKGNNPHPIIIAPTCANRSGNAELMPKNDNFIALMNTTCN